MYVDDIRQPTSGNWLITQFDLTGETPRKQVPLELIDLDRVKHLVEGRVYVATAEQTDDLLPVLRPLHPLVLLELDEAKVFFLNTKAKKRNAEYLCYKSGEETVQRPELGHDHRELLGTILGAPVDLAALDAFAARSQAEEPQGIDESQDGEPEMLGDFELRSVLGRGGMGVVYRAWQPSLGSEVAVKALQRSVTPRRTRGSGGRFERWGGSSIRGWSRSTRPARRGTAGTTRWNWSKGRTSARCAVYWGRRVPPRKSASSSGAKRSAPPMTRCSPANNRSVRNHARTPPTPSPPSQWEPASQAPPPRSVTAATCDRSPNWGDKWPKHCTRCTPQE